MSGSVKAGVCYLLESRHIAWWHRGMSSVPHYCIRSIWSESNNNCSILSQLFSSLRNVTLQLRWLSRHSDGLRTGRPRFNSQQEQENCLYSVAQRQVLGPTQLPIQCVPGALSPVVNWPGREVDHSPPSCAEVNGGAVTPLRHTSLWRDV
jgi:hypothetical protein